MIHQNPKKLYVSKITSATCRPHTSVARRPQKCKMLDLGTNQHGDHGNMTQLVQHELAVRKSDLILPPCVSGTSEECPPPEHTLGYHESTPQGSLQSLPHFHSPPDKEKEHRTGGRCP